MIQINRRAFWALLALFSVAVVASSDVPIQWRGNRGWEPESSYCQLYHADTVVTLRGNVQRVEKVVPLKGMSPGIHFILKTATETIPVHLGPKAFVDKQPVQLATGDSVEVTGSRVRCDGKPVILAANVKRGSEVLTLRDLEGRPAWAAIPPPK